eukprot:396201-Rhodomonas_salina.1
MHRGWCDRDWHTGRARRRARRPAGAAAAEELLSRTFVEPEHEPLALIPASSRSGGDLLPVPLHLPVEGSTGQQEPCSGTAARAKWPGWVWCTVTVVIKVEEDNLNYNQD